MIFLPKLSSAISAVFLPTNSWSIFYKKKIINVLSVLQPAIRASCGQHVLAHKSQALILMVHSWAQATDGNSATIRTVLPCQQSRFDLSQISRKRGSSFLFPTCLGRSKETLFAGQDCTIDHRILINYVRDGPLEKLWGSGEFLSSRNFFSPSNSLYEFFLGRSMNIFQG